LILDRLSALGGSGEVSIISALCDGDVAYAIKEPLTAAARPVPREGARIWPERPIVVLVNEHTISAGEALALALRELAHAKISPFATVYRGSALAAFSALGPISTEPTSSLAGLHEDGKDRAG